MNLTTILYRPINTEKSMRLAGKNRLVMQVHRQSSKPQIKEAIEHYFHVNVTRIHTLIVPGKSGHSGKRHLKTVAQAWKKAVIELKAGQSLNLMEPVKQEAKKEGQ